MANRVAVDYFSNFSFAMENFVLVSTWNDCSTLSTMAQLSFSTIVKLTGQSEGAVIREGEGHSVENEMTLG